MVVLQVMALTLHGDMTLSVIDEMPPGRLPVKTYAYHDKKADRKKGACLLCMLTSVINMAVTVHGDMALSVMNEMSHDKWDDLCDARRANTKLAPCLVATAALFQSCILCLTTM